MRDAHLELYGDRRQAKRDRAAVKVYLLGELWSRRGKTRNISRRGVFVETDWQGFFLGTRVDLTFVQKESGVIRLRRYAAVVVRRSDNGLGLQFCWAPHLDRLESSRSLA